MYIVQTISSNSAQICLRIALGRANVAPKCARKLVCKLFHLKQTRLGTVKGHPQKTSFKLFEFNNLKVELCNQIIIILMINLKKKKISQVCGTQEFNLKTKNIHFQSSLKFTNSNC